MEETAKDQSSTAITGTMTAPKSKLRYPLRSAAKKPDQASPAKLSSNTRRVRQAGAAVSQSVGVLDLSGKERSAKPPRRMSIPMKSAALSPSTAVLGGPVTPISETRLLRSTNGIRAKTVAPVSDASRSAGRFRAFDLTSSTYWLSQIKLSESASKHSVSIGFFKLALEAGCQPVKKMRDELKAYTRRHKLEEEHGDAVNELLEAYNIPNVPDQVQFSESCSGVPQEGTRSSDDEVHSVASAAGTARKLKPKSLNAAKCTSPKGTTTAAAMSSTKGSLSKSLANLRPGGHNKAQKRTQKMSKQEPGRDSDKTKVKNPAKESATEGQVNHAPCTDSIQENKENVDGGVVDEISVGETM